jgi:hypothetical protein
MAKRKRLDAFTRAYIEAALGFWDRKGDKRVLDALSEACRRFGEFYLYVGDDGKIHGR